MKLYEILDGNRKEKMFSCIYLWTNLINNKKYVGQTQHFYDRMYQYKNNSGNIYLKNAIKKYGVENFEITILEKCNINFLDEREQYWIDYFQSYKKDLGYNICPFASTTRGYKHTEETKEKIRQTRSERQYIQCCGELNGMYGKHHTTESKQKISQSSKKLWEKPEYRRLQSERMRGENNYFYGKHLNGDKNPRFGSHCSQETKEKIRNALIGKPNLSCSIPIICIETGKHYQSMTEAAKELGAYTSAIKLAVDNPNKTCCGYHFTKIL